MNAAGAASAAAAGARDSIDERRHSSTATQDLNDYIFSTEDADANVDDDDVFETEPTAASDGAAGGGGGGGSEASAPLPPSNGSGGGGGAALSASEAKRRTQSLGSLSGEPKSPRKVLNVLAHLLASLSLSLFLFFFSFFVLLLRSLSLCAQRPLGLQNESRRRRPQRN